MASRFPLLILTVFTIFLLIGICISLPYRRDTSMQLSNCGENVPHVVIINATNGKILNCHKCTVCQEGHGLSTPCIGQNISQSDLNIECKPCVAGVNFSTGDTIQCQPCQKFCQDGEKIEGKCEATGEKRTCEKCELKNWYYNMTQGTCLPCVCKNMTAEIKRICTGLGFNVQCNKDPSANTTTNTPFSPQNGKGDVWKTKYTIIVVCVIAGIALLMVYCWCITKRVKKLKIDHPRLSICSKGWFCKIFFFKETTRSRPPSYHSYIVHDDRPTQNGNGRVIYRQHSCPVTEIEKCKVKQNPNGDNQENDKLLVNLPECKQKALKFFDMNMETCRQICQGLHDNIDTGMGYPTLAGYMDFSANKVKTFEGKGVCEKMFRCWSDSDKENNVLKLKDLAAKLKRDDILELLKSELRKVECGCSECVIV